MEDPVSFRSARPETERRQDSRLDAVAGPGHAQTVNMMLGTFREMPGLCLHVNQAARLFGLRQESCQTLLEGLVATGQLRRADDGQFVAGDLGRVPPSAARKSVTKPA